MATTDAAVLNQLTTSIQSMIKAQQTQMKEILGRFDTRRISDSPKTRMEVAKRQKLQEAELDQLKKGLKAVEAFDTALMDASVEVKKGSVHQKEFLDRFGKHLESVIGNTNSATDAQIKMVERAHELLQNGRIEEAFKMASMAADQLGVQEKKLVDAKEKEIKMTDRAAKAMAAWDDVIEASIKEFFTFGNALQSATAGLVQSFDGLEFALKHQVPMMDILGHGLQQAASTYGISVKKLMEVQAAYAQQMIAASGGVQSMTEVSNKFLGANAKMQAATYKLTGSLNDAAELTEQTFDIQQLQGMHKGFDQLTDSALGPGGLLSAFQKLALETGKPVSELIKMNSVLMDDYDYRTSILGLGARERSARLEEIVAIEKGLIAKGMEADQATKATLALQKLTNQVNPKERYKETMKLATFATAMGVRGAERLPQLMMDPIKNANAISEIMTAIQAKQGAMMAPGQNLGIQQLGYMLGQVGGGTQQTLAQLSTAGMAGKAIDPDTIKAIDKTAEQQLTQLTGIQQTELDIKKAAERVGNLLQDPTVNFAKSALQGLGKILLDALELGVGAKLLGMGGGMFGKLGGLLSRLTGAAGAAGEGLAALGGGGAAGAALAAGGLAASGGVGYGIGTLINKGTAWATGGEDLSARLVDVLEKMTGAHQVTNDTIMQALNDNLKMLNDTLTQNNNLTDDQKKAITTQINTTKQHIDELKKNTDATNANTQKTDQSTQMGGSEPGAVTH